MYSRQPAGLLAGGKDIAYSPRNEFCILFHGRDGARPLTMLKDRTTMRWLLCLLILLSAPSAAFSAGAGDLKILISIDQPTVVAPFPAQVSLHLHNSGTQPLLIYTPVRDASVVSGAINPFISEQPGPGGT